MSVFGFLRPKYKHPNPDVRAAAVAKLDEQPVLAEIASTDEDAAVRAAALQRLTDQELRAQIARSRSASNVAALDGITDPKWIAAVAQHAESAPVRVLATSRLEDVRILQKIASHDPDPAVRRQSRTRLGNAASLPAHLRTLLAGLEVGATASTGNGTSSGALDDVCSAISQDGRFQIDAVVTPGASPAGSPGDAAPSHPGAAIGNRLELLAHARAGGVPQLPAAALHYRIEIWRCGEDLYQWSLSERRSELTSDVQSWATSSRG